MYLHDQFIIHQKIYTTILVGKNASLFLVLMISNVIH